MENNRARRRINKMYCYDNFDQSKSKSRDHSFDYTQSKINQTKKYEHIQRETNDYYKRNVVTPDRNISYIKHNKSDDVNNLKLQYSSYNHIENPNQFNDNSLYIKDRNQNSRKDKLLLMRYSNSPSPLKDYSVNNYKQSSNSINQYRYSSNYQLNNKETNNNLQFDNNDLRHKQQNIFKEYIHNNNNQQNKSSSCNSTKSNKTSYTKYETSLRYNNTNPDNWSNINTNSKINYNEALSHSQYTADNSNTPLSKYNTNNNSLYSNSQNQVKLMTRNKEKSFDNQKLIVNKVNDNLSYLYQTNRDNDSSYQNYSTYMSSNHNKYDISDTYYYKQSNNIHHYQKIPIRSKLLQQEPSIQSNSSSSHSPMIHKQEVIPSSIKTNSTAIGTFEDLHFLNDDRKKNTIETIEEMHFIFIKMIQNAKKLLIKIENKNNNNNNYDTVSYLTEQDYYYD